MELYHNGNASNLLSKTTKVENPYQAIENDKLFKAYCDLVTTTYFIEHNETKVRVIN